MKTIKDYRRENNELKSECARLKVDEQLTHFAWISYKTENDELKAALTEAIKLMEEAVFFCDDIQCEHGKPHHESCSIGKHDKLKSLPTVQRVMKEGE